MIRHARHLRSTSPSLALLSLLILFTAGFFMLHQVGGIVNTITLPIEVFPPDGGSVYSEPVVVYISDPTGVDSLYIQGHALGYQKSPYADKVGYDKKASFRINGGAWVDIDNAHARVFIPEANYGGIGGAFNTLRMKLPVSGVVAGANTIEFRFNGTDGVGAGYRILKLDLLRKNGQSAIDGTAFVEDDPDTWTAPLPSQSDINAGAALWRARNSLNKSPLAPTRIIAACSDCHSTTGRDLKYFNFSNKSIISRSAFHGLSARQGQQIASYIRSIDLQLPSGTTVSDAGRPWNPPYQPGPGLRNKPVELWAAGAGINAVLDDDWDMLPYLFPNGYTGSAGMAVASPDSFIPNDEIPIAIQLADWNNWLPDVWPGDVVGQATWLASADYQTMEVDAPANVAANRAQLIADAQAGVRQNLMRGITQIFGQIGQQHLAERFTVPAPWNSSSEKIDDLSYSQWVAVKMWETMTTYKLEDLGDEIFCSQNAKACTKDRTWPLANQAIFNVAPHKNSRPEYPINSPYHTAAMTHFYSTVWYEAQMILNSGNRTTTGNTPMDWNYTHEHIGTAANNYGDNQYLRWVKAQITVVQESNGSFSPSEHGFNYHTVDPARILVGSKWQNIWQGEYARHAAEIDGISATLMRAWLTKAMRYPASEWPRDALTHLSPAGYTPHDDGSYPNMASSSTADTYMELVGRLSDHGISPMLVDSAARWGESMWPNGNWEQWMMASPPTPPDCSAGHHRRYTENTPAGRLEPDFSIRTATRLQPRYNPGGYSAADQARQE